MLNIRHYHPAVICNEHLSYPAFPYNPPESYPELVDCGNTDQSNNLYPALRNLLRSLQFDKDNFNTPSWNPFKNLIKPGQIVVIKPNYVMDHNPIDDSIESLVTHSSIIKTVLDYVLIALDRQGTIIVADAPLQMCNFDRLKERTRIDELLHIYVKQFSGVSFSLIDMRKTVLKNNQSRIMLKSGQISQDGDPNGYSLVDLNRSSLLTDIDDRFEQFRVTCYDHNMLHQHHNKTKHEYLVANSFLKADAIINLPKMKCHKKAGLTGALKNLIGINGHKEFLPHHMNGSVVEGGDQYLYPSRIKNVYNKLYDKYWSSGYESSNLTGKTVALLSKAIRTFGKEENLEGSWYGNETIPRTTIDLNHIAYYYDLEKQTLSDCVQRTAFHLVDGIVAGERNGPLEPETLNAGVVIGGTNPVLVDIAIASIIGYNPDCIKTLKYALSHTKSRLVSDVSVADIDRAIYLNDLINTNKLPNLSFRKPRYWEQSER